MGIYSLSGLCYRINYRFSADMRGKGFMANKNLFLFGCCFVCLGLFGCVAPERIQEPVAKVNATDGFLERYHNANMTRGATVVVNVSSIKNSDVFHTFITADLKDAGFNVKPVNPIDVLPHEIQGKITASSKYSFVETALKSIYTSAAGDKQNNMSISEEAFKGLAGNTEVRENNARVNDLSKYIDDYQALLKKLDIDYMITVRQGAQYSYYTEIVNLRTSSIAGVYYLSANRDGWLKRMPGLKNTPERTMSSGIATSDVSRYAEMQYSNYLVSLISGKRILSNAKTTEE